MRVLASGNRLPGGTDRTGLGTCRSRSSWNHNCGGVMGGHGSPGHGIHEPRERVWRGHLRLFHEGFSFFVMKNTH